MGSQQHTYGEIEAALSAIVPHGATFELRLLTDRKGRIDSGYFTSPASAASALAALTEYYKGIYLTPNPVKPDLLARAANRIHPWAQVTTMDPDVVERRWLLVDGDPVRPTGISSTDAEHGAALARMQLIKETLGLLWGFCDPIIGDSGNGGHLMYPMIEVNNEQVRDDVARFLKCLSAKFSDQAVNIDTTVFNAARIWKVPGTWTRKGDSTPDRPHRKARILQQIHHLSTVTMAQVNAFSAAHEHLLPDRQRLNGLTTQKNATEYPDDERKWKTLNNSAMARIAEWVPVFFPAARQYKQGFRIASADIGRLFEEDITIHPWPLGIKDFGVADQGDNTEGRRTPIGIIAEYCFSGDKELTARKLADLLKVPVSEFETPMVLTSQLPGFAEQRPRISFKGIRSMADLRAMPMKDQKFIIPGVLPTGNMMLASRPKMRKTWLALQLGMAITRGRKFLEWQCERGDVLFLGLEDNQRRLRARIQKLLTFEMDVGDLSGFRYWTAGMDVNASGQLYVSNPEEQAELRDKFPRGEAGVQALDQYLDEFPLTSTIIIDTYAHFREASNNRDVYQRDYDAMMPITKLAAKRGVLIIPVHHEKKGNAHRMTDGDFLEDVSGSSGITGGVDGVISIKGRRGVQEGPEQRKLMLSGRDIPYDYEIDMNFDAERGGWMPAARQDAKLAIIALLQRHPWLNQQELSGLLPDVSRPRLSQMLAQLKVEGMVTQGKLGYGLVQQTFGQQTQ